MDWNSCSYTWMARCWLPWSCLAMTTAVALDVYIWVKCNFKTKCRSKEIFLQRSLIASFFFGYCMVTLSFMFISLVPRCVEQTSKDGENSLCVIHDTT